MKKSRAFFIFWGIGLLLLASRGMGFIKEVEHVAKPLAQLGNSEKSFPLQITSLAFSPDGKILASGKRNGAIAAWNMETNSVMYEIKGYDGFEKNMLYGFEDFIRFRPQGKSFLTFTEEDKIKEWNAHTGEQMESPFISAGKPQFPRSYQSHFDFSKSGKLIALFHFNTNVDMIGSDTIFRGVKIIDAESGKTIKKLDTIYPVSILSFSMDEKSLLMVGSYDWGSAWMYNIESGEEIWREKGSRSGGTGSPFFNGGAFSPDNQCFAIATDAYWGGATIQLWKYPSLEKSHILKVKQGHIKFAFSPDGNLIAVSGLHPHVEIFDVKTGNKITEFKAHDKRVYAIAFSPDGKKLATGSDDTTIKIWDMTELDKKITGNEKGF
ncbi:PD40 domain-containing protein [Candidatus Sumerlaeota bacterium]|nr:PD40 domain-containing protein [Candidatus Sumerlaeota bacterium]